MSRLQMASVIASSIDIAFSFLAPLSPDVPVVPMAETMLFTSSEVRLVPGRTTWARVRDAEPPISGSIQVRTWEQ